MNHNSEGLHQTGHVLSAELWGWAAFSEFRPPAQRVVLALSHAVTFAIFVIGMRARFLNLIIMRASLLRNGLRQDMLLATCSVLRNREITTDDRSGVTKIDTTKVPLRKARMTAWTTTKRARSERLLSLRDAQANPSRLWSITHANLGSMSVRLGRRDYLTNISPLHFVKFWFETIRMV